MWQHDNVTVIWCYYSVTARQCDDVTLVWQCDIMREHTSLLLPSAITRRIRSSLSVGSPSVRNRITSIESSNWPWNRVRQRITVRTTATYTSACRSRMSIDTGRMCHQSMRDLYSITGGMGWYHAIGFLWKVIALKMCQTNTKQIENY